MQGGRVAQGADPLAFEKLPRTDTELEKWLPDAKARGFAIVPLTAIVKRRGQIG